MAERMIVTVLFHLTITLLAQRARALCPDVYECRCYPMYPTGLKAECDNDQELDYIPWDLPSNLTHLEMKRTGLTVIYADALSNYSMLLVLELQDNKLVEIEVNALSNVPELEVINLSHNNFSVLEADIFSDTPALTSVNLANNNLLQLPELPLPQLKTFDAKGNQLSVIKSEHFSTCGKLSALDLSNNKLDDLAANAFRGLIGIESLYLQNNKLTFVASESLTGLETLRMLNLAKNEIEALPPNAFSGLSDLIDLELSDNNISLVQNDAFKGLSKLNKVNLAYNHLLSVPSLALSELSGSLTRLDLQGNLFTSLTDDAFSNLGLLTDLLLGFHKDLTIVEFGSFRGLSELTSLSLTSCPKLTNLTLEEIPDKHLMKLMYLQIDNNGFTHLDETTFRNKANLIRLELSRNPFHCSCALKWMPRVVEEGVVWAQHWRSSGTPPRCQTPSILEAYQIAVMKEGDFTCDEAIINPESPQHKEAYLKQSVTFEARLHRGIPASHWWTPRGDLYVPLRYPPLPGLESDKMVGGMKRNNIKVEEFLDPEDHSVLASITISDISLTDDGIYPLMAANIKGNVTYDFRLEVFPFEMTTQTEEAVTTGAVSGVSASWLLALSVLMFVYNMRK